MKNSYKLYGVFWDKRTIPEEGLKIIIASEKKDLVNTAFLSAMMSTEHPEEYQCGTGENKILYLDFIPCSGSVTVWDFYLKRVLQIADYCCANILCCKNKDDADYIKDALDSYYKRKTPNRLLAQSNGVFQMIC